MIWSFSKFGGVIMCKSNFESLYYKNPSLAKEWHPIKNGELTPKDVTIGSGKMVWWICERGHEWQAKISNRTILGNYCPYCRGKKVNDENCLATVNPLLAKEWHPTKNGELTPKDVTIGSKKKVWWQCEKGHEWQITVTNRSRNGCPKCSASLHTSFPEQAIFYYLRNIFLDAQNRHYIKIDRRKFEMDIYIPVLNIAIEYDGFHHQKGVKRGEKKNLAFNSKGIRLIRIRDRKLPILKQDPNVLVLVHETSPESKSIESLEKCITQIFDFILENYKLKDNLKEHIRILNPPNIEEDRINILS
jgi:hypothetical protein